MKKHMKWILVAAVVVAAVWYWKKKKAAYPAPAAGPGVGTQMQRA